jgi:hypothetical protein
MTYTESFTDIKISVIKIIINIKATVDVMNIMYIITIIDGLGLKCVLAAGIFTLNASLTRPIHHYLPYR